MQPRPAACLMLLIAGIAAAPAAAEIGVDDVWAHWQSAAARSGQTVTAGGEARSATTLTLTDVTSRMGDDSVATIPEVRLIEDGAGRVRMEVSESYRLEVAGAAEEGTTPTDMVFEIRQSGLDLVASGDPDAIDYDYSAAQVSLELVSATQDGTPVDLEITATADGLEGRYAFGAGDGAADGADAFDGAIASTLTVARLSLRLDGTDPDAEDGAGQVSISAEIADIAAATDGTVPLSPGSDMAGLIASGGSTRGEVSFGTATWALAGGPAAAAGAAGAVSGGAAGAALDGGAASGAAEFTVDAAGLRYDGQTRDARVTIRAADMPVPEIALTMAATETRLQLPLAASPEAQDMAVAIELRDVALAEDAWSAIDPAGVLPRDPAQVALDLSATVILDEDIGADPTAQAAPGEIRTATLNALSVSMLGAALTGAGAFTFDAATPPQPEGRIDLRLAGANALLDRLATMGLIPADQAMGARMMIGMFARPGAGEDTLETAIEVQADGAILLNGQRVR